MTNRKTGGMHCPSKGTLPGIALRRSNFITTASVPHCQILLAVGCSLLFRDPPYLYRDSSRKGTIPVPLCSAFDAYIIQNGGAIAHRSILQHSVIPQSQPALSPPCHFVYQRGLPFRERLLFLAAGTGLEPVTSGRLRAKNEREPARL